MKPKQIIIVGYDRLTGLDLVGPMEAFGSATVRLAGGQEKRCYEVTVAALGEKHFRSEFGLTFKAQKSLASIHDADTVLVPGGSGLREPKAQRVLVQWLKKTAGSLRRITSVCTGIYGIAPSGLLDGRKVTTHWRFASDVARRFPKLKLELNSLFVRDGKFWTAAGVTAGIDLSLALIEEDYGPEVAINVARELVVYMKRPGGQEQYSAPLQFQSQARGRFADLLPWIHANLDRDLSVETLSEKACLCPRQFSRRFKREFGSTPAAFVRRMRLDEARQRLGGPECSIEEVGRSVGFRNGDTFRRSFEKCFRVVPREYRGRFGAKR